MFAILEQAEFNRLEIIALLPIFVSDSTYYRMRKKHGDDMLEALEIYPRSLFDDPLVKSGIEVIINRMGEPVYIWESDSK